MIISESGFPVLQTSFTSAYSARFYQRVDLLHFGHCPYLGEDSAVVHLNISIQTFCVIRFERITG